MNESRDAETIHQCLAEWLIYGRGLHCDTLSERCKQTEAALEALGRIAQPSYLDAYPHSPKPENPDNLT